MTTRLDKTLRRELDINGRAFVVSISPEGLKLTLKGHRKGFELLWESLVSGDEALTVALNASVGQFTAEKQIELTTQKNKARRSSTAKKSSAGRGASKNAAALAKVSK